MTTPTDIHAAYKRHEDAAGGLSSADVNECLRAAAVECGVSVEVARAMLLESPLFAGNAGRG